MTQLRLLDESGSLRSAEIAPAPNWTQPTSALRSRTAFAAAHVVPNAFGNNTPDIPAEIDWDSTIAYRKYLWSWGLGVADAMDTAQRNMGLDAVAIRELIKNSADAAAPVARERGVEVPDLLVVGVNTDHVDQQDLSLAEITSAYMEQLEYAQDTGAGTVLMASRHLARTAKSPEDYVKVYSDILANVSRPTILHWLGEVFDPNLKGYFNGAGIDAAIKTFLGIIHDNPGKVRGVKMSLLDASYELTVRAQLPEGVRLLTGDDYNYVDLIAGDGTHHSDALLGAFSTIGPAASAALQRLDEGDEAGYREILQPTEPLSQHIFSTPTYYYKTGVAFMSWLNGHQQAFQMVGGLHSARSLPHLSRTVELANAAGVLENPELAADRWHSLLQVNGL